ncbi:zinc knuckle CX2CX4HX4C containing protein [Tanacetum coccineum]
MSNIEKLKFSALEITGENYIQWTGYVKRHLKSMGPLATIQEGNKCTEDVKAKADVFFHQHINEMLEFEYSSYDDPSILWKELEVNEYTSALFRICCTVRFCEQTVTEADMLEKTFSIFYASNINLQQQYRLQNFKRYSDLNVNLLVAVKNNELLMKNHQNCLTGSLAIPEANDVDNNDKMMLTIMITETMETKEDEHRKDVRDDGIPLTTVGELNLLIKSIEAGKHDELLSGMTNDERMAIMDALDTICNSIQADNNNADVIPCKNSHVDDLTNLNIDESTMPNDPIVQSVDINTKSTSYAGAAVVEKARNNWAKHGLKRIMMNNKGFFFFKFDSRARLEAILEGGPWLIRNSPIILKKWSMDTRLLKEELTSIPIWVKLHDVPIQVFEEYGISLIATFIGKPIMLDSYTSSMCNDSWGRSSFARCLIEVNSEVDLVDVVTIGIPSLTGDDFIKETIHKKRKGKSKSTNVGQFAGPSIKPNVRYEPKAITSSPKKGATNEGNASRSPTMSKTTGYSSKNDNIITSNSYSALNEEEDEEEDIENVYDETANLFPNTKTGESSSFTSAAG